MTHGSRVFFKSGDERQCEEQSLCQIGPASKQRCRQRQMAGYRSNIARQHATIEPQMVETRGLKRRLLRQHSKDVFSVYLDVQLKTKYAQSNAQNRHSTAANQSLYTFANRQSDTRLVNILKKDDILVPRLRKYSQKEHVVMYIRAFSLTSGIVRVTEQRVGT